MVEYRNEREFVDEKELHFCFELLEIYFNVKKENIKKEYLEEILEDGYCFYYNLHTECIDEWVDGRYFCTVEKERKEMAIEQLIEVNKDLGSNITTKDIENFFSEYLFD